MHAAKAQQATYHWAWLSARVATLVAMTALFFTLFIARPAHTMEIKNVKSPGGIEAWLVEDHSVPLISLRFAFEGGSSQDPDGKEGLTNFLTAMLDEGAGDLNSNAFQERMEELAIKLSFSDSKDSFYGNFQTLSKNRDEALTLLRLALTEPRFDDEAVNRMRAQLLANIAFSARNPERVASKAWYATAFEGHPYGRPSSGTEDSLAAITREDLAKHRKALFAKSNLKVVAVGDIDAASLKTLLDDVFGPLNDTADLRDVPQVVPKKGGVQQVVEMNVPQSVAIFGTGAMARKDPDFMTAFVLNQIIGGGGFASRLMEEVREQRGLAYSVYSYILPYRHTSIYSGAVATRNDAIMKSLDVIRDQLKKIAETGPTKSELEDAKSYLIGSYALRFDTSSKIASQLLGLLEEGFGSEYITDRNAMITAVTIEDTKRVAQRLLDVDNLIVTIVGKPPQPGDKS
jgi:zinc protease